MAQSHSQLISDVVIAGIAILITAYLGTSALAGEIGWASFLGYLIFARLCLVSLRGALSAVTGFARHYPAARNLYDLLASSPGPERHQEETLRPSRRGGHSIGDRKTAQASRGMPIAALTAVPVTRYNAYYFVDCLTGRRSPYNDPLRRSCYCVSNALEAAPGGSLRELLRMPGDTPAHQIEAVVCKPGSGERLLPVDPHTPLTHEEWGALPRHIRAHILLAAAAKSDADLLLVEADVLKASRDKFRREWWKQVRDRFLVVRHTDPGDIGSYGETLALAMGTDRAVRASTVKWCRKNSTPIREWLEAHHEAASGQARTNHGEEDDLEE